MLVEVMKRRMTVLPVALASAVTVMGCGLLGPNDPVVVFVTATPHPTAEVVVVGQQEGVVQPVELTRTAMEWRKMREQHASLIESAGGTPTLEPTPDSYALEESAVARVLAAYDDVGYESEDHAGWFDPAKGLYFFRDGSGDWTTSRNRKNNPYSPLFYYGSYPPSVANFKAGTIQRQMARELAFEAARLMPVLGNPTPGMVDLMYDELGWAIRDHKDPVVNVWSSFSVTGREVGLQRFAVGGVLELGVERAGEGDDWYEYLVVKDWRGPVVVERLR